MFLETVKIAQTYSRLSKTGREHVYTRTHTLARFICDACQQPFERLLGNMDYRRLNNNYYHVCSNCDAKRFAQSKGVERRRIWNMSVDTDIDISKI